MQPVVERSNDLTRRWIGEQDWRPGAVLSGVGVWPLLAALASGASGAALEELEAATGATRAEAAASVSALVALLRSAPSLSLVLGAWASAEVPLSDAWRAALPAVVTGSLPTDLGQAQTLLDRWASQGTDGLIPTFPLRVTPATRFVLASAVAADVRWEQPYEPGMARWEGDGGWVQWLTGKHVALDLAAVVVTGEQRVSVFVSRATDDLDVHLLAGEPADDPSAVLATGIDAIAGRVEIRAGSTLGIGEQAGALVVEEVPSIDPRPMLRVGVPAFDVRSRHDLLAFDGLFGLVSAQDPSRGHFAGISSYPLAVEAGAQSVVASFTAEGFRAAAVSAFAARAGSARPQGSAKQVRLTFDRPFGFLAVQRSTGLVLFAGWIASTDQLHSAE